jgi:hypothetical protein
LLGIPQRLLGLTLQWGRDENAPPDQRYFNTVKISIPVAVRKVVKFLELEHAKIKDIPANPDIRLHKDDCPGPDQLSPETQAMQSKFRTTAGSCIWIQTTCRPDIAYAVTTICSYMTNPGYPHMNAAIWLAQYLKGTEDWGVQYSDKGKQTLVGYADSDYGSDHTFRNTYMYIFTLCGGPISWKSAYSSISLSTAEAEIRSVDGAKEAIKQLIWLSKICHDMGLNLIEVDQDNNTLPLTIRQDNEAMIAYAMNGGSHTTMKYLEKALAWIRQAVIMHDITFLYLKSEDMPADIGTKALRSPPFVYLRGKIMVP